MLSILSIVRWCVHDCAVQCDALWYNEVYYDTGQYNAVHYDRVCTVQ